MAALTSRRRRTVALLASWLGFYVLGLAIALGLLFIPYAQASYGGGIDLGGGLALAGGAWVAWGLVPIFKKDRSRTERPLREDEHPALRELVRDVAQRAGYPAPDEIHLVASANAYAYRASAWPRRGASVVGIGLPLLAWLDRRGIEAVVAHELGHHVAGDTRLGPWVHRTRKSMARAIEHLEGSSFFLHLPFVAYAEAFIKYSLGVSRAQELSADELSLRLAGKRAVATALVNNERRCPLWGAYLAMEVIPILEVGFLPPLLDGWRLFQSAVEENAVRSRRAESTTPHDLDTHPTLSQRLEAVGAVREDALLEGAALELLDGVARAEESVLRGLLVQEDRPLRPVTWEQVAGEVWLPRWRESLAEQSELSALALHELPEVLGRRDRWFALTRRGLALLSPGAEEKRLLHLLGTWLSVKLADAGFTMETLPGRPVRAHQDSLDVEPFKLVQDLASRADLSADLSKEPAKQVWARLVACSSR